MPTFVAFKDGQKLADVVGANPGALEVRTVFTSELALEINPRPFSCPGFDQEQCHGLILFVMFHCPS